MNKTIYVDTCDKRMIYCLNYLKKNHISTTDNPDTADYIILAFNSEFKEIYKNKEIIFSYGDKLKGICSNVKNYCTKEFVLMNSALTAQGTLALLLDNINRKIDELKIIVLGYGNCGKEICNILLALKCQVSCFARNIGLEEEIVSKNIDFTNKIEDITGFDVIINTIPFNIISNELLGKLDDNTVYIETASFPYGFDLLNNGNYNFRIIQGSALPGKYTPQSAGENTAKSVLRLLGEDGYE